VCHAPAARPPFPPISGGAGIVGTDELILEAADGARFLAFGARTTDPGAPGIVVMPDVRGLHPFYRDLAERFAEAGVDAVAMDYFGRTAGTAPRDHESFQFRQHMNRASPETISLDVAAAVAHLRSGAGGGVSRVFTVGFCLGGRHSFNQAAGDHGLEGVIGFYGYPQPFGPDDDDAPVRRAGSYACRVLGLFGGADPDISIDDVAGFREALDAAGVSNELVVEEGATHSFFDRRASEFAAASDDAWRRILRFVGVAG
jgi:carboxymethylenebutenolidase